MSPSTESATPTHGVSPVGARGRGAEPNGISRRVPTCVLWAILLLTLLLALGGCGPADGGAREGDADAPAPEPEQPVTLTLLCVGDIMTHRPQIDAHFDARTDSYDFRPDFRLVRPRIESADLAMGNFEATFGGKPYSGYPMFSAPDDLADALADTGFDVLFTANNHMADRGEAGIRRTIETIRAAGMAAVGSRTEGEENYTLTSRSGITVGLTAFTYETPRAGDARTLNGVRLSATAAPLVNSFGYEDIDGDLARITRTVGAARAAGADVVVCYFHWGSEYARVPNFYQKYIAGKAAEAGADVVFGSHPHVLQTATTLEDAAGRRTPVFWSMGNFISNQSRETVGDPYTEQGMMALVTLRILASSGERLDIETRVIPTYTDISVRGGRATYTVVPLTGEPESEAALAESGHADRARRTLEYCRELFGEGMIR